MHATCNAHLIPLHVTVVTILGEVCPQIIELHIKFNSRTNAKCKTMSLRKSIFLFTDVRRTDVRAQRPVLMIRPFLCGVK